MKLLIATAFRITVVSTGRFDLHAISTKSADWSIPHKMPRPALANRSTLLGKPDADVNRPTARDLCYPVGFSHNHRAV